MASESLVIRQQGLTMPLKLNGRLDMRCSVGFCWRIRYWDCIYYYWDWLLWGHGYMKCIFWLRLSKTRYVLLKWIKNGSLLNWGDEQCPLHWKTPSSEHKAYYGRNCTFCYWKPWRHQRSQLHCWRCYSLWIAVVMCWSSTQSRPLLRKNEREL